MFNNCSPLPRSGLLLSLRSLLSLCFSMNLFLSSQENCASDKHLLIHVRRNEHESQSCQSHPLQTHTLTSSVIWHQPCTTCDTIMAPVPHTHTHTHTEALNKPKAHSLALNQEIFLSVRSRGSWTQTHRHSCSLNSPICLSVGELKNENRPELFRT